MMKSAYPENYYTNLSNDLKHQIDQWQEKRTLLIQKQLHKLVDQTLEDDDSFHSPGVPLIRVMVKAIYDIENTSKPIENNEAMLTIWQVTDEQLSILKEGSVIRLKNIGVKSSLRDGMLQLNANAKTRMELQKSQPSTWLLKLAGYRKRNNLSILRINILARKLAQESNTISVEIDTSGAIIKVTFEHYESSVMTRMYLTDKSGLILRIDRNFEDTAFNQPIKHWTGENGFGKMGSVIAVKDLRMISFDREENCAVAIWTKVTTILVNNRVDERLQMLKQWSASLKGQEMLVKLSLSISNSVILIGRLPQNMMTTVAYILNVWEHKTTNLIRDEFSTRKENTFRILFDCGINALYLAGLNWFLLENVQQSIKRSLPKIDTTQTDSHKDSVLESFLNLIYNRNVLFQLLLRKTTYYKETDIDAPSLEVIKLIRVESDSYGRVLAPECVNNNAS